MSKLSYLARVMSGVRLKKMNQMIDIVHDKCGQNKVKTFFDMCWCGARYGAGYYDYVMFGFYNMNGRQRDTYLTRVRNKKVIDHMNDLSYSDEFDELVKTANKSFDKDERLKLYAQAEKIMISDLAAIAPVCYRVQKAVLRSNVQGWDYNVFSTAGHRHVSIAD